MRLVTRRGLALVAVLAIQAALLPLALASAEDHDENGLEVEVVATGLRNPRHIGTAGPSNEEIYVAEAGVGGEDCFGVRDPETGEIVVDPETEEPVQSCFGETGRISMIDLGEDPEDAAIPVLDGLPSLVEEGSGGWFAVGPHDVAPVPGEELGYVVIGFGGDPRYREDYAEDGDNPLIEHLGTAILGDFSADDYMVVADLSEFEGEVNPDGDPPEEDGLHANPYSVLFEDLGDDEANLIVSEAGGNALLRVPVEAEQTEPTDMEDIEIITVFPPNPQPFPPFIPAPPEARFPGDSVPTTVIWGYEDDLLVGELPGFPFHPGAARVWSVGNDTEVEADLVADGFASVIDMAIGPEDGRLYVLEITNQGLLAAEMTGDLTGALVRYDPASGTRELLLDDLFAPTGLAFTGEDDDLVISNCGVCADTGPDEAPTGHLLLVSGVQGAEAIASTQPVSAETDENQPIVIELDEAMSDNLEVTRVVDTGNGATWTGSLGYQPAAHFSGEDRVMYQACVEEGGCLFGEVHIEVNDLPTGRFDGPGRVETAVRVSRGHFPQGASTVLLARADQYPDALAGSVLAGAVGAPILLTPGNALHPAVIEEINRLGASSAYILGGPAALSEAVEASVVADTSVSEATRLRGPNRFATAVAILEEVEEVIEQDVTAVYVAEGQHEDAARGWPDVLSASALAAREGRPILLVTHGLLHPATEEALRDGITAATIVGGQSAVSAQVESAIDGIVDDVNRIEGRTRYETSAAIAAVAMEAGLDEDFLYLATGRNWPDALAAGPAAARAGGLLMLVDPVSLDNSPPVGAFLREHRPFTSINLLGGPGAISAAVETQVRAEAAGS